MNVGASVLIYGRDPVLLETRRQVLRQSGCRVSTIASLAELSQHQENGFQILVLCHTLSSKDQQEAIALGEKINRKLKTIVMGLYSPDFTLGIRSRFIRPFDGPEALSALVREAVWDSEDVWTAHRSSDVSINNLVLQGSLSESRSGWMYQKADSDVTIHVTFATTSAR